jgi:hypothetical protein
MLLWHYQRAGETTMIARRPARMTAVVRLVIAPAEINTLADRYLWNAQSVGELADDRSNLRPYQHQDGNDDDHDQKENQFILDRALSFKK